MPIFRLFGRDGAECSYDGYQPVAGALILRGDWWENGNDLRFGQCAAGEAVATTLGVDDLRAPLEHPVHVRPGVRPEIRAGFAAIRGDDAWLH